MSYQDPQHVRRRRTRIALPPWASYSLMALFVIGVVALGYLTFSGVKDFVTGLPGKPNPNPIFGGGPGSSTQSAPEVVNPEAEWTGGRVNILLLGIDQRQSEEGPWRTDTMILVMVDPTTKRAGMISMPRDLWVRIPDYNVNDKINTAHFRGDADNYPGGGGPALAKKTVQNFLGLQVDYFVEINFYAFLKGVDQLGCIPVTVSETIDDPTYPAIDGYGFDPFHIDPGNYCMNADTLLKYARTRATFGSDFDRAARQQQVIYAIRDHVLDSGQLPQLLARAPQIYDTVRDGTKTDLTLQQMVALARLGSQIPKENICSKVINGDYIDSMQTLPDNSQVLVPDIEKVHQLVLDVSNGAGVCIPGGEDLKAKAASERATVNLLNGTRQEGLATDTGNMLAASGINVIAVGNADRFDYQQTIIYNYKNKPYTARYIAQLLRIPETAIVNAPDAAALFDIRIIIGADYVK